MEAALPLLLLSLAAAAATSSEPYPSDDCQALVNLRSHFTDPRGTLSRWNVSQCCTWPGVACGNRTGCVLRLDVAGFNLSAAASALPSLCNLPLLQSLDLSANNFSGPIPPYFVISKSSCSSETLA